MPHILIWKSGLFGEVIMIILSIKTFSKLKDNEILLEIIARIIACLTAYRPTSFTSFMIALPDYLTNYIVTWFLFSSQLPFFLSVSYPYEHLSWHHELTKEINLIVGVKYLCHISSSRLKVNKQNHMLLNRKDKRLFTMRLSRNVT